MIPRGISKIFSNLLKVDDFFFISFYVKVNKNNRINIPAYMNH